MSCNLQNIFVWFLKVSWIARRSKIIFLKFYKSWNVLQPSKYFSMIFKSILDCQKVQINFSEAWQVLKCHPTFKIYLYDFYKTPGSLEGPKLLSWSFTSPGTYYNHQNIFLWFLKVSWIARRSKRTLLKFDKLWNVLQYSKYFSMIFKSILDYQKVQKDFTEVWQVMECPASFKIFFYDF